jgi:hypothetical protein
MLLPLPWVCQMTPPSRLGDAFLRGLHAEELVRPRHLLLPASKMMKLRIRSSSRALLHICASGRSSSAPGGCAPAAGAPRPSTHEELLRRAGGAVAQPLRVAARQHELHGAEEALVEDLFLVGDELAHAVGHLHRAALELDHRDGEAVEVEHDVGRRS